jgi:hypothetical protein
LVWGLVAVLTDSLEEVLSWFDERGDRYLRSEEKAAQAQERADSLKMLSDRLLAKLQELGIDPNDLD